MVRFTYVEQNEIDVYLTTELYKNVVEEGYTLIGDSKQFRDAKCFWSHLSGLEGYCVDLLDIYTANILDVGVTLCHDLNEVDHHIPGWSRDEKSIASRPVFRKEVKKEDPST